MSKEQVAYWKTAFFEFDGRCAYCGLNLLAGAKRFRFSTVDHVYPTALGGTNEPSNLVPACHECNGVKSKLLPEDISLPEAKWIDRDRLGRVTIKPQSKKQYCLKIYRKHIHPSITKYAGDDYEDYLTWFKEQKALAGTL